MFFKMCAIFQTLSVDKGCTKFVEYASCCLSILKFNIGKIEVPYSLLVPSIRSDKGCGSPSPPAG